MFSRFEGWDLEHIRVWQGEENKSKKQRKCQSSFRPETWPPFLHINVMKHSLSVRSQRRGRDLEGDGELMEEQPLQVAARSESSGSQSLPKLHRISANIAMSSNQSHLNKEKKKSTHRCERKYVPKEIKQKAVNHWSGHLPGER